MPIFEELDLASQFLVDKYCDEYRHAATTSQYPSIAEYVSRVDAEATKVVLFRELLTIELHARKERGDSIQLDVVEKLVPDQTVPKQNELVSQIVNEATEPDRQLDAKSTKSSNSDASVELPDWLGHYQILEPIGSGAFGDVWKAKDSKLGRIVAIKTPRQQRSDDNESERFVKEAQAAARLSHPNVVAIHEICQHTGRPFIVSEFIDGESLDRWRSKHKPTSSLAVEVCVEIAEALQHAHESGVIHRDLKPSNILMNSQGKPLVTDFGLAKVLSDETITIQGNLLGSPAYMSPEQARGDSFRADPRSDVYSLGVILYELLTGERPFRGSPESVLHQVVYTDPTGPRELDRSIARELETICLKCLTKEPQRRYQSVAEFSKDLRMFSMGRPISARPVSMAGKLLLWCKRNRALALASSVAVLAILLLSIGGPLVALQRVKDFGELKRRYYVADMIVAADAFNRSNLNRTRQILGKYANDPLLKDSRNFDWYYLQNQVDRVGRNRTTLGGPLVDISASSDGNLLAAAVSDTCQILNSKDLTVVKQLDHRSAKAVAFHPTKLVLATSGEGGVRIWDIETGRQIDELAEMATWSMEYSGDGRYLASCEMLANIVTLWDFQTGKMTAITDPGQCFYDLAFSPTDAQIAVTSFSGRGPTNSPNDDATVTIITLATAGEHIVQQFRLGSFWARQVAFSADGVTLAVTDHQNVKLIDIQKGEITGQLRCKSAESVAWSPTGSLLAVGSWIGPVTVFPVGASEFSNGGEPITLKGHSSQVRSLLFTPTGSLVSASKVTGEIINWRVPDSKTNVLVKHEERLVTVDVASDSQTIVSVSDDGVVVVTNADSGETIREFRVARRGPHIPYVSIAPRRNTLAVIDGKSVVVQELLTGKRIATFDNESTTFHRIAFSPDGATLAVVDAQSRLILWHVESNEVVDSQLDSVRAMAFSPSGDRIAVACGTDVLCLEMPSLSQLYVCQGHTAEVEAVAFSSNGELASGSRDSTIRLWHAASGRSLHTFPTSGNYVMELAFSPDGMTLASGTVSHVKLWNMGTREETITLDEAIPMVNGLSFSGDGELLVAGSLDKTVRIWRAPRIRQNVRRSSHLMAH